MAATNLGPIMDQLGIEADLDDGDLVSSAVVVMSILVPGDHNPRLAISSSDGMSWVEQTGLLRLAELITSAPPDPACECGE